MNLFSDVEAFPVNIIPLSRLKFQELLAEGGFAEIYRASSPDHGAVVVRRLKSNYRFKFRERSYFLLGIRVRRLCGPLQQIVQYRGEFGGLFSLPGEIIEWVDGDNLKTLIYKRNRIIVEKPAEILRQCAAALMHVHQVGYLHLDVKPENFLVKFEDGKPIVKLTDFDLVRPITESQAPDRFGGSLMYLPPEFFENNKMISVATDIFAFGVLAFNLLTGQMPFVGSVESLLRSGNYRIIFPSHPPIPEELKEVVVKCLAYKPSGRFKSAAELYSTLEQIRVKLAQKR